MECTECEHFAHEQIGSFKWEFVCLYHGKRINPFGLSCDNFVKSEMIVESEISEGEDYILLN